jgi:hypothetical protein
MWSFSNYLITAEDIALGNRVNKRIGNLASSTSDAHSDWIFWL